MIYQKHNSMNGESTYIWNLGIAFLVFVKAYDECWPRLVTKKFWGFK